jgi:hypothetical protein
MHVGVHYTSQTFKNNSLSFHNINGYLTCPLVSTTHAEKEGK